MIVFAAITPHTPLLLPTIGKEHVSTLSQTHAAFQTLHRQLTAAKPDTILIISPHGAQLPDAITINLHETYQGTLAEFGDYSTKPTFRADIELIDRIQRAMRKSQQPLTLHSEETIDYGMTVPLVLLAGSPPPKLIPLTQAAFDFKTHYDFGEKLKDTVSASSKRVAIIASTDLSHRLSSETPLGFSPRGAEFDELIRESIETGSYSRLLRLEPDFVAEAAPCGLRGVLMILGMLSGMSVAPSVLAYEHPFGVGYLTAHLALS
ncbi:MAG: AmmeMemoRadiSam system protein B [bacterium]|nr:AmmeMemoRadiSam system protein B [bacterium]